MSKPVERFESADSPAPEQVSAEPWNPSTWQTPLARSKDAIPMVSNETEGLPHRPMPQTQTTPGVLSHEKNAEKEAQENKPKFVWTPQPLRMSKT